MSNWAIHTHQLSRQFGALRAVDNLDLAIEPGTLYGFLGPNGSGKSTTIRMLCGLLQPSSGEIDVLGLSIPTQAEALKQRIGYMTQSFSLYRDLTVRENLSFLCDIFSLSRRQQRERIATLLQEYHLEPLANRIAGTLSGGERQRLALAAALVHRPELLFLDEPTSAVDPNSRRDFWEQLFNLTHQGITILVSTHYMDEAERCHQLAIFDHGQKVTEGAPAALLETIAEQTLELSSPALSQAKRALMAEPMVQSVSQLGNKLRILLQQPDQNAAQMLMQSLSTQGMQAAISPCSPNLEDLFVSVTQAKAPRIQPKEQA